MKLGEIEEVNWECPPGIDAVWRQAVIGGWIVLYYKYESVRGTIGGWETVQNLVSSAFYPDPDAEHCRRNT